MPERILPVLNRRREAASKSVMPRPKPRSNWLDTVVDVEASNTSDPARVRRGYALLREILGAAPEPDDGPLRPIDGFLGAILGGGPMQWHELGFMLDGLRREPGFDGHLARLRSEDQETVRGKLAELSTLHVLRAAGQPARLARDKARGNKVADILLGPEERWDVEVSVLDLPSTWEAAMNLRQRIQARLGAVMQTVGRSFTVNVRLRGYAYELAPRVGEAATAFANAVASESTARDRELIPNFIFSWSPGSPFICVGETTILGADPNASERAWTRLYAKVVEEAAQVRPGGIVLIHTEALAIEAAGENARTLYDAVLGELATYLVGSHLGAIGMLERVVAERLSGGPPEKWSSVARRSESKWQRLLWLPNRACSGGPPLRAERWFAPPYPW